MRTSQGLVGLMRSIFPGKSCHDRSLVCLIGKMIGRETNILPEHLQHSDPDSSCLEVLVPAIYHTAAPDPVSPKHNYATYSGILILTVAMR